MILELKTKKYIDITELQGVKISAKLLHQMCQKIVIICVASILACVIVDADVVVVVVVVVVVAAAVVVTNSITLSLLHNSERILFYVTVAYYKLSVMA